MIRYYCPHCKKEVKYYADIDSYRCTHCNIWLAESEVRMEEDDLDSIEHHL